MDQRLRLSIGIPAHNEVSNIKQLLRSILDQSQDRFVISEVLVVSDASTDHTVLEANSLGSPLIRVIDRPTREGQASCQNQIIREFTGDALMLFNADIQITDPSFMGKMLAELKSDPAIGIISPAVTPLPAENFFESVINSSVNWKSGLYAGINGGDTIYLCHGRARLLSKNFAKKLSFPLSAGEDAFSYITCHKLGYVFRYLPTVQVHYRSPQTLADHFKQSTRFFKGRGLFSQDAENRRFYTIPLIRLISWLFIYLFKNPVYFLCYLTILIWSRFKSLYYSPTPIWEEAASSKKL